MTTNIEARKRVNLALAAPELLEALKELLSDTQNGELATVGQVRKAKAAIAKAEGGQ
jgi:hypothetical protein